MSMQRKGSTLTIALAAAMLLGGCATTGMKSECRAPNYPMALAGTVIGGLLGGQIGAGTGRHVAIAAGAGIGAVTGSRIDCP